MFGELRDGARCVLFSGVAACLALAGCGTSEPGGASSTGGVTSPTPSGGQPQPGGATALGGATGSAGRTGTDDANTSGGSGGRDASITDSGRNGGAADGGPAAPDTKLPSVDPGLPVILYTDMVSAPAGAYLTLWGHGFGAAQGASTVTLGGLAMARYVSWSADKIELKLPDSAASGALVVHSERGDSPELTFSIHAGRLLFVDATSGNDSWSGTLEAPAGGDGPFRSLTKGRDALRAGDVLYVRAGTFTAEERYSAVLALKSVPSGTASAPVAIIAYPAEQVTLGDNTLEDSISTYRGDNGPVLDYLVIAKFRLRPKCHAMVIQNCNYGRLVGNEITGAKDKCGSGSGLVSASQSWATVPLQGWKMLGNVLYDNGVSKLNHGIYLGGVGTNSDFEIAWNRISQQAGGRAIQIYGHKANDRIERISIHDNEISEIDADAILLGYSDEPPLHLSDIQVFNNVLWRAGRCWGWGVSVENPTATNIVIENNTFYDNGSGSSVCDPSWNRPGNQGVTESQLRVERGGVSVRIRNNLFASLGNEADVDTAEAGGAASGSNNLFTRPPPAWDASPAAGSPTFVDAANRNFHLGAGSAAIDKAVASALVTADHDGIIRPQGAAPDIGAYEAVP